MDIDDFFTKELYKGADISKISEDVPAKRDRADFVRSLAGKCQAVVDAVSFVHFDDEYWENVPETEADMVREFISNSRWTSAEILEERCIMSREELLKKISKDDSAYSVKTRWTFGVNFGKDVFSFLCFLASMWDIRVNVQRAGLGFIITSPDDARLFDPGRNNSYGQTAMWRQGDIPYRLKYVESWKTLDCPSVRETFKNDFFDEFRFFENDMENARKIDGFFDRYGKARKVGYTPDPDLPRKRLIRTRSGSGEVEYLPAL